MTHLSAPRVTPRNCSRNGVEPSVEVSILQRARAFGPGARAWSTLGRMQARRRALRIAAVCSSLLVPRPSLAHIDLLSPLPRASGLGNANLDHAPCGQRNPGRIEERASMFRPGESVTVTWDAYVQHPSYFRLAFDLEGDDSFSERAGVPTNPERDDPTQLSPGTNEIVLGYVEDHPGELEHVEQVVTLPRQPCERCTLQLIQFIYNVPLDEATYYQCADIVLRGEPLELPAEANDASSGEKSAPESGCTFTRGAPPVAPGRSAALSALALLVWRARRRRAP